VLSPFNEVGADGSRDGSLGCDPDERIWLEIDRVHSRKQSAGIIPVRQGTINPETRQVSARVEALVLLRPGHCSDACDVGARFCFFDPAADGRKGSLVADQQPASNVC
jgi:hypothetical protein